MMERRTVVYDQYDYRMSSILKEGKSGAFEIKKEIFPEGTIINMYDSDKGIIFKGRYTFPYPTVILRRNGYPIMSDTQLEVESLSKFLNMVWGTVLVSGLGIGLLPTLIGNIKGSAIIKRIDIVEKHQEVIDLVYEQIASRKTHIIHDDIFHYLKTTNNTYDFIHIDIWNDITAPIKEIADAAEKAKRCLKPEGIVWCWLQELYDRIKDKLPKEPTPSTKPPGVHEPCLICGKTLRNDYAGLCMDCADIMGVSEMCKEVASG